MTAQVVGLVLGTVGAWLLWSPWAFVIGAVVLLAAPELAEANARRRRPTP